MKRMRSITAAFLLSTLFFACKKEAELIPVKMQSETQPTIPQVHTLQGLWIGKRYSFEKSLPVYFVFDLKSEKKLDVLTNDGEVIGTGSWSFDSDVFKATYALTSSGDIHFFTSNYYDGPNKMSGTWGHTNSDSNGGPWQLSRTK